MTKQQVANSMLAGYPWTSSDIVGGAGVTMPLTQSITFSPDNTHDIGATGANRPRDMFMRGKIVAAEGTNSQVTIGASVTGAYIVGSSFGTLLLGSVSSPRWLLDINGHFTPWSSNTLDLGTSSTRVRSLYLAADADVAGDLILSGTGKRIKGDFSNATHANRLLFQNSAANSPTRVGILPSGSNDTAALNLYGASDPNNASVFSMYATAAAAVIQTSVLGTGSQVPVSFVVNGAARLTVATAGDITVNTGSLVLDTNAKQLRGKHANGTVYDLIGTTGDNWTNVNSGPSGFLVHNNAVTLRILTLDNSGNLGVTGDFTMSGSGKLIKGDFTSGSQIRFQTNQVNASTSFQCVPNGSGNLSSFFAWDRVDTGNGVYAGFSAQSGQTYLKAHRLGTAAEPGFQIWTGNTSRLGITAAGLVSMPAGLDMAGTPLQNFGYGYGATSIDLGNAGNMLNQIRAVKAWGGPLTLYATGSSGFVVGGGIQAASGWTMNNGESYIFISQQGYWWSIASGGVI
jgi:hypothetical protein